MSGHRAWRWGVVAAMLGMANPAVRGQSLDPLVGRWSLDSAKSDDPTKAVDSVAARMPFLARGMVRGRLRRVVASWPSLVIGRSALGVRVALPGEAPIDAPLAGPAVPWENGEGRAMCAAARLQGVAPADRIGTTPLDGAVLVVRLAADDGAERRQLFARASDAPDRLVMEVRMVAPRLPRPIAYQLVYRRAP